MVDQSESAKHTSLESLVEYRAPVSQFIPLFKNRREAAKYFATAHAALNNLQGANGRCVSCESEPAANVAVYRWCATFFDGVGFGPLEMLLLLLGHVGVKLKTEVVTFDTFHPICGSCIRQMRRRRWAANVLNFIGLFFTIIAGGAAALCWSGAFYYDKPIERNGMIVGAIISSAVLAFGIACLWPLKRLRIPASIRYLSQRPFYYQSSKMVSGTVK